MDFDFDGWDFNTRKYYVPTSRKLRVTAAAAVAGERWWGPQPEPRTESEALSGFAPARQSGFLDALGESRGRDLHHEGCCAILYAARP